MKVSNDRNLILLAHGSRDSNWCQTFEQGLDVINGKLSDDACLAYMEMASPSLETVISNHYLKGCRKIDVLPLFFAAGRHLLHDVPKQIEELHVRFPDMDIKLLEAAGHQQAFWQALAGMIAEGYEASAKDAVIESAVG